MTDSEYAANILYISGTAAGMDTNAAYISANYGVNIGKIIHLK